MAEEDAKLAAEGRGVKRAAPDDDAASKADALKAAKKRALEEAKKAALAALEANSDKKEEAEEADPISIVDFLKKESEAVAGSRLKETTAEGSDGVIFKGAIYERREPKPEDPKNLQLAISEEGGPSNLPPGARPAGRAHGHWSWGGSQGGVTFSRSAQIRAQRPGIGYNSNGQATAAAPEPKAVPAVPARVGGAPVVAAAVVPGGSPAPQIRPAVPSLVGAAPPGVVPARPPAPPRVGEGLRPTLTRPPGFQNWQQQQKTSWNDGWGQPQW